MLSNLQKRQVKSAFVLKGKTFKEIAEKHGCTRGYVSHVFNGLTVDVAIQKSIARAAGMKYSELWG